MTLQLPVYVDGVNLLGDNIKATKKNKEALSDANKTLGPKVDRDDCIYMLISHHQNAGQTHRAYRSSENVKTLQI
jgi:hypothetical protein